MSQIDSSLVALLAEAMKPLIQEAVFEVLNQQKPQEEEDLTDINGAGEITKLKPASIYIQMCKNKKDGADPKRIPEDCYFKRARKIYFSKSKLREWITQKS